MVSKKNKIRKKQTRKKHTRKKHKKRRSEKNKRTKEKKNSKLSPTLAEPCFKGDEILNKKCISKKNPIIAILTMPVPYSSKAHARSYLPQSCVKWLEMSGARVVPIPFDLPTNVILSILEQCNGFACWGSRTESLSSGNIVDTMRIKAFIRALDDIFQYILSQNIKGNYYPVLGVGDGMQWVLNTATFGKKRSKKYLSNKALQTFYNKDISIVNAELMETTIKFTKKPSVIKNLFTPEERKKMATEKLIFTNHTLGYVVGAPYMKKYIKATENSPTQMVINATAKGRTGKEYVMIYSFKHLPIYGVEMLPNATTFQWEINIDEGKYDKSLNKLAQKISRKISQFFVNECKKNLNKLGDHKLLISNYNLFGIRKLKKILYPNQTLYKYQKFNFENGYFFNVTRY